MAALGIAGISGRRKVRTTVRDKAKTPAKDLVGRQFSPTGPDQLLVGDITFIPTDEGTLYVTSVLDVFSRRQLGWSIAITYEPSCASTPYISRPPPEVPFPSTGPSSAPTTAVSVSDLFAKACRRMGYYPVDGRRRQ